MWTATTAGTPRLRREHLEKEVALLSDGSLDKDMLDQYARYQLTYSKANEIVIFNK